jgi:hypothetical protein
VRVDEDQGDENDEAFLTKVSALFAPGTALGAFDMFKRIVMPQAGRLSVDAVLEYVLAYERAEALCKASMPGDTLVRDVFVAGLKPRRLHERVLVRAPSTLAEAKVFALVEAELLAAVAKEAAALAPAPVPPKGAQRAPGQASQRPDASSGGVASAPMMRAPSTIVCHECGEQGHKRFECPQRARREGGQQRGQAAPAAAMPAARPGWPAGDQRGAGGAPFGRGQAKAVQTVAKQSVGGVVDDADAVPRFALELIPISTGGLALSGATAVRVRALLDTGSIVSLVCYGRVM